MTKFVKVMFGKVSGADSNLEYKLDQINIANTWNPKASNPREMGGFNISTENKILRWLVRGDTIYDVEVPKDAEVIIVDSDKGIYKTNKMIIKNPRKITDEMAYNLYLKSNLLETSYYKSLAGCAIRGYRDTCLKIIVDKVNKDNIDLVLSEWNDFHNTGHCTENGNKEVDNEIYEYLNEIKSNLLISRFVDKEPYIKEITNDNIINLTGQSGSGKSTYASKYFNSNDYLIIDTDEIFSEHRYKNTTGINKELGEYFRNKYDVLPNCGDDFDLIYKEILEYTKNYNKIIVIDCAQFHCIKDISILKGKLIVIRTSINTCYNRTIERYKNNYPNYTNDELEKYKEKKKGIFKWYKYTNKFIENIDLFVNNRNNHKK